MYVGIKGGKKKGMHQERLFTHRVHQPVLTTITRQASLSPNDLESPEAHTLHAYFYMQFDWLTVGPHATSCHDHHRQAMLAPAPNEREVESSGTVLSGRGKERREALHLELVIGDSSRRADRVTKTRGWTRWNAVFPRR